MPIVSRLLCVIDPTADHQPALQRAVWVARNTGAELELLICYYNEFLSGDRFFDALSLENARAETTHGHERKLEALADPLRNEGLVVKTTVIFDHPLYAGVTRQVVRSGADMVFKDTHHHAAISRALFTPTDWNLTRTCPVPLWLVKPHPVEEPVVFIAAIDPLNQNDKPAALDDQILQLSKSIAGDLNGDVHAFHSYDPRVGLAVATANAYIPVSLPFDEIERQICDQHKNRFDEITQFYEIGTERCHLISGLAHEELPALAANLNATVVVMGAVARNPWQRIFIGATAERTMEHLPCDLLIVKPDWFHTPVDLKQKAPVAGPPATETPNNNSIAESRCFKRKDLDRMPY